MLGVDIHCSVHYSSLTSAHCCISGSCFRRLEVASTHSEPYANYGNHVCTLHTANGDLTT